MGESGAFGRAVARGRLVLLWHQGQSCVRTLARLLASGRKDQGVLSEECALGKNVTWFLDQCERSQSSAGLISGYGHICLRCSRRGVRKTIVRTQAESRHAVFRAERIQAGEAARALSPPSSLV